ncbi:phage virion morphogenesis protein [Undibacterium hunanense]|uniref:phage virion morphogenesis protein n=1 Tax=Undibacterium hunanense TaxID=2762292 RepID=UPI001E3E08E7|nr:phage virion morphogenesis protein [Undibacterium hunanense]
MERIARVHQFGLNDRVAKNGQEIKYARRELIGFNSAERVQIRISLFKYFQP